MSFSHRIIIRAEAHYHITILNHLSNYQVESLIILYAKGCFDITFRTSRADPPYIRQLRYIVPNRYFSKSSISLPPLFTSDESE